MFFIVPLISYFVILEKKEIRAKIAAGYDKNRRGMSR
jgi:hypothetical protein